MKDGQDSLHIRSTRSIGKGFLMRGILLAFLMGSFVMGNMGELAAKNVLQIPPLIDSREMKGVIDLRMQRGTHEFYPGVESETMGFNGSYLGPALRMYRGEDTRIRFTNEIGEATTVHGHGLQVRGELDGGPQGMLQAGAVWDVTLPIRQEASFNWFHPHLMGRTAEHVYAGLVGLYIIEDENSLSLGLPHEYGVNDIPLIVQDRDFIGKKMAPYRKNGHVQMSGFRGDTLVVNGTVDAVLRVPKGLIRLRILNGGNAQFFSFYLKGNKPFYKIATEGGFLEKPVMITQMRMAPSERNEIIVDLSKVPHGKSIELMAAFLPIHDGGGFFSGVINAFTGTKKTVVRLEVDSTLKGVVTKLPERLNTIEFYRVADAKVTRSFVLQMRGGMMGMMGGMMSRGGDSRGGMMSRGGDSGSSVRRVGMSDCSNGPFGSFTINGRPMKFDFINERVSLGVLERWRVTGEMLSHPFHLHGASFQVISSNGQPPPPEDRGWKDTVVVSDGVWVELLVQFAHTATPEYPYMYHCHILEHEDACMMGQFTVSRRPTYEN